MALLAALGLLGPARAQNLNAAQKAQVDVFVARTGLPRAWVTSVKPGMVVAIRDGAAARGPGEKIRLQGEVVDEEAAERLGYKSMRSMVEVNCETRRDRVVEMETFASPNLKGEGQARKLPGGWVQPSEDAYMADVIRAVCRGAPRMEVAREDTPAPKADLAPARVAPTPRPPSAAKPPAAAPEPAPPLRPAAFTPPPRPPSPDGPIATAPRPPRLLVAEAAPTLPVATPAPPSDAAPPPRPASPKRPAPAVASAAPSGPVAQVGSLSSEAGARRALSALSPLMSSGLGVRIQTATVDGRTFYRAFVTGFASRAEATAFCARVTSKGGPCLAR